MHRLIMIFNKEEHIGNLLFQVICRTDYAAQSNVVFFFFFFMTRVGGSAEEQMLFAAAVSRFSFTLPIFNSLSVWLCISVIPAYFSVKITD